MYCISSRRRSAVEVTIPRASIHRAEWSLLAAEAVESSVSISSALGALTSSAIAMPIAAVVGGEALYLGLHCGGIISF
jgi:hypothetical protein